MKIFPIVVILISVGIGTASANSEARKHEWRQTDFTTPSVPFSEIWSSGPPKDDIPPIDKPRFTKVGDVTNIGKIEPGIGLTINGKTVVYPMPILMWHQIVNGTVEGVPFTITFCPLYNATIVFNARLNRKVLDCGTTGKLFNSNLVMWDRQA